MSVCAFCKKELPTKTDPNDIFKNALIKVKIKDLKEALLHSRWPCVDGYLKKHGYSNFKKILKGEKNERI